YTNEPYAIAKIAGIKLCESYNLQYGTNFLSVMPTNLYGPNDNFNLETSHVLPALIRKIHLGKCLENNDWDVIKKDLNARPIEGINGDAPKETILAKLSHFGVLPPLGGIEGGCRVEIWGSGAPMREFLWSEEMAEACVYVMEHVNFSDVAMKGVIPTTKEEGSTISKGSLTSLGMTTEVRNTHINIGTGREVSIRQVAELIKEKVGFSGELVFNTSKPDGTMKKLTDPSKIHALGWHHKIEIDEGIERLYQWYTQNQ
ncbi:MAG: NAD-dependent epimerase/dehydratase family protein, partial [Prolixibacteraceae bacterium]|nr:NAD-dependent epimerase/dehydratase family protein [Prolixibacteraceae bacterium]